jgi:hypothetical protein
VAALAVAKAPGCHQNLLGFGGSDRCRAQGLLEVGQILWLRPQLAVLIEQTFIALSTAPKQGVIAECSYSRANCVDRTRFFCQERSTELVPQLAKSWLVDEGTGRITVMGRGGNGITGNYELAWRRAPVPQSLDGDQEIDALLAAVAERIDPYLGLSIIDAGRLDDAYHGHAEGTPYVTVFASCLDEKQFARRALAGLAGLNELAWDYGWRGAESKGKLGSAIDVLPASTLDT